tara:strand:- start:580 stop:711 length:132 start_codon:yes stop_codon:yes gene_type:complete
LNLAQEKELLSELGTILNNMSNKQTEEYRKGRDAYDKFLAITK